MQDYTWTSQTGKGGKSVSNGGLGSDRLQVSIRYSNKNKGHFFIAMGSSIELARREK